MDRVVTKKKLCEFNKTLYEIDTLVAYYANLYNIRVWTCTTIVSTCTQKVDKRQPMQHIIDKTKVCASCGEVKAWLKFQRKLTLAQTKAYLRNPDARTRYITQSKNCSECRAQRKSKKPLTADQIRTKISTGDMHPMIGEAKLKQKREAIPLVKSRIMKEYWQKKRTDWVDELKTNLQKQVTAYANRYYSYQNQMPDDPTDRQHALLDQHKYNYAEAQRIRQDLLEQARKVVEDGIGTNVPKDIQINELIKRRKVV